MNSQPLYYFRLSDEELLMEAEMASMSAAGVGHRAIDPRIWNEATRRGIAGRLNAVLSRTPFSPLVAGRKPISPKEEGGSIS